MLTVIWDVDDVLNDLTYRWFTQGWKSEHPECRLSYTELTSNPPHESLGVDLEVYLASMDRFRTTQSARDLAPHPEVLAWFGEDGHRFRHIALTARPLETAPDLAHWVMRYFGAWIRCFGVVPTRTQPGVPVYDRTKGEYLAWLGRGDVLVDDSMENNRQAATLGLHTLLFSQPWNNGAMSVFALLRQLTNMKG